MVRGIRCKCILYLIWIITTVQSRGVGARTPAIQLGKIVVGRGSRAFIPNACSSAARSNLGDAVAVPAANNIPQVKLMIFGGEGHKTYLGCLSCSEYATDSVFNQYGNYGSRYAIDSVWNHYSDFGSRYSNYGACNPYANDPPVIVGL